MNLTHDDRHAALLMLRTLGPAAQARAARLAKERLANNDADGWELWSRVHSAIDELRYTGRRPPPKRSRA